MLVYGLTNFLVCLLAAVLFMSMVFLAARSLGRYDLADAAWGWIFIVVTIASYVLGTGPSLQLDTQTLVTVLVIAWGVRLSWHLTKRLASSKREDPRYAELRATWRGNEIVNAFLRFFVLQAALATVVALPVIVVNLFSGAGSGASAGLHWWVVAGVIVWLFGFIFETVSDRQLRDFMDTPENKGKLLKRGLRRYSRHPNYFGELVQWWGIFIIAIGVPFGWIGAIGPALLTYLILLVSGVPRIEKWLSQKPGWAAYKARTSKLIPWAPRTP